MNRTALTIQMLQLLKSRGKMSREELADELQTNIRNIFEFKKELEMAGYYIDSISGKDGGYMLNSDSLLPSLKLSAKEYKALQEAHVYVSSTPDFIGKKDLDSAIDKINNSQFEQERSNNIYLSGDVSMVNEKISSMIELCELGKKQSRCVEITYYSLHSKVEKKVLLQPYEILNYHQAYYCLGYNVDVKEFRIYKFSVERMKNCVITDKRFNRDLDFKLNDHIGKHGLIREDVQELELIVSGDVAVYISERNVGIHCEKNWSDHQLHMKCLMENKMQAISFILSLGKNCKVLAPESLKNEIYHEICEMYQNYQTYR